MQSGIGIAFSHKKSFCFRSILKQTLVDSFLFVSLKFKTSLGLRDSGTSAQNNTPQAGGNYVPQAATVPASNSTIEADSNDGFNTGLKLVDDIVQAKLAGGYSRSGQSSFAEGLRFDSGYEVIAVPMFGGWGTVYGGATAGVSGHTVQTADSLPWATTGAGNFKTMDRALVALQHPLAIHHVIVAVNYAGPGSEPLGETLHLQPMGQTGP